MKRVIMGYSGSGKSTLLRSLNENKNTPTLHLDQINFIQNWEKRDEKEAKKQVRDFLNENTSWIIDGNYSYLYRKERVDTADEIILLLFSRQSCFINVLKRWQTYRGTARPDVTTGCPEELKLSFLWWVLFSGRTRKKREYFLLLKEEFPEKTIIIKNKKELKKYLNNLEE